jgi:hypothetical protein
MSLGVTPSRFDFEHMPRGITVEKELQISGVEYGEPITISYEGEGADWITFSTGNSFRFSDSTNPITARVSIPMDVPNGEYTVAVRMHQGTTLAEDSGDMAIISGVRTEFSIEVTGEQITDFEVRTISIPQLEEQDPILVRLIINNRGNVLANPGKVDIAITDNYRKQVYMTESVAVTGGVEPFSIGELLVEMPHTLPPGEYVALVSTYGVEKKEVVFVVTEAGSSGKSGMLDHMQFPRRVILGEPFLIKGLFRNTGKNGVRAQFHGEIYLDGKLVQVIESDELLVAPEEEVWLNKHFTPDIPGEYVIKGYVSYSGKQTGEQVATFFVDKGAGLQTPARFIVPVLIIIFLIIAIVYMTVMIVKSRQ